MERLELSRVESGRGSVPARMKSQLLLEGSVLSCFMILFSACASEAPEPEIPSMAPTVATLSASALGTSAMTVNGSIHPHGKHTTYYFEYGSSTDYGSKTDARPLPPQLAAYYHETWDEGLGGWYSWLKDEHFASGGVSNGYIRFHEPSNHDRNHDDGIGTLHLTKFLMSGEVAGGDSVRAHLGGGDPDLRGARVSIGVRGNDFQPNGSEVMWWTQSQSNVEVGNAKGWKRANWAYTGFTLTDYLSDGEWHRVEYRLLNDADQWTYGGNNPTLQGEESAKRYAYWSINDAQAHVNCDFFHLEATVDTDNPPTGSLDFDELQIAYRNHFLVVPSNGGKLVEWPQTGGDPGTLTDGWRHGEGRGWHSAANPTAPLEFVYAFENPVTIKKVQLHQNSEWPAKEVELLVSADGKEYSSALKKVLPQSGEPNANFGFTLDVGLSLECRFLKVRLNSGYQTQHWGLGEIEVFGSGAVMLPDDDLYYVNLDLENLTPGNVYHYRLVASSSEGTVYGEDRTYGLPASNQPTAVTGKASQITASRARLEGRMNPLGHRAEFHFEYGTTPSYGSKSPVRDGGLQITPRTTFERLTDLNPQTTYHYRLVGSNQEGTAHGEDATFTTGSKSP